MNGRSDCFVAKRTYSEPSPHIGTLPTFRGFIWQVLNSVLNTQYLNLHKTIHFPVWEKIQSLMAVKNCCHDTMIVKRELINESSKDCGAAALSPMHTFTHVT